MNTPPRMQLKQRAISSHNERGSAIQGEREKLVVISITAVGNHGLHRDMFHHATERLDHLFALRF